LNEILKDQVMWRCWCACLCETNQLKFYVNGSTTTVTPENLRISVRSEMCYYFRISVCDKKMAIRLSTFWLL